MMFIKDKVYLDYKLIQPALKDLIDLFTYHNPKYFESIKNGYSVRGISKTLLNYTHAIENPNHYIVFPRGRVQDIKNVLKKHNLDRRLINYSTCGRSIPNISFNPDIPNFKLSEAQVRIRETLIRNSGGLILAGCGSGKTVACLSTIAAIKRKTLIIVTTTVLQKQWVEEIKLYLKGEFTVGTLGGKTTKDTDADIVVAIINSVRKKCKLENTSIKPDYSYLEQFGALVVDEVHNASSLMFKTIVDNSPSLYRIGVTGTVKRKDQLECFVYDSFGKVLVEIEEHEVKDRILDFDVEKVETASTIKIPPRKCFIRYKKSGSYLNADITAGTDALINDIGRNNLIVAKAVEAIKKGHKVLVLTYRTEHAHHLFNELSKQYKGYLIIGETSKKFDANKVKKDTEYSFIVANKVSAGEGMDIPELSCLLLTLPSSNMPRLKQYIGRIRRKSANKHLKPLVIDFVDSYVTCSSFDAQGNEKDVYIYRYSWKKRQAFYNEVLSDYAKETI